jgi:hypothetical protein
LRAVTAQRSSEFARIWSRLEDRVVDVVVTHPVSRRDGHCVSLFLLFVVKKLLPGIMTL